MEKVQGIKSVDFKVLAKGYGVVNWNGSISYQKSKEEIDKAGLKGKTGEKQYLNNNHTIPKLRGYSNKVIKKTIDGKNYEFNEDPKNIDFKKHPLYISQNCIRHHLFKDESYDFHSADEQGNNSEDLLISISGLLRGYVLPKASQAKRRSPLLITDFVDKLYNGNFEQFANSGGKNENSIFSKTTFGETEYYAYGSLSIEDIQFISLDKKFDRAALNMNKVNDEDGKRIAKKLEQFISSLSDEENLNIKAEFGDYYRIGSIFKETEKGILLNQGAIKVLVDLAIEMIESLTIRQAKGWMQVKNIEIDYNDGKEMMRILEKPENIKETQQENFAIYYKKVGK